MVVPRIVTWRGCLRDNSLIVPGSGGELSDQSTQQDAEPGQIGNDSISLTIQVKEAKKTRTLLSLAAGAIALVAIVAGVSGQGIVALWCLPLFFVLGVAANVTNQNVRRLTTPGSPPSVGRQVAEGILLAVLAFFFLGLLFLVWAWQELGKTGG